MVAGHIGLESYTTHYHRKSTMKNYYEILGVSKDAGEDEIRKMYRKLAMEFHPDRNPENSQAEEKFKDIAEAYGVLTDPEKRRQYDLHMAMGGSHTSTQNGGFSYNQEDILKDLFRDPRFQQMFQGLMREFQRSGLRASPNFFRQSFFGGKGGLFIGGLFLFGSLAAPVIAKGGRKALPSSKGIFEKIGHSVGNMLGMRRKPENSSAGFPSDIVYKTPVSENELRRGKWTEVVTYGEKGREVLKVKIPGGSRYGQKLRLRGKGRKNSGGRGDLYLELIRK